MVEQGGLAGAGFAGDEHHAAAAAAGGGEVRVQLSQAAFPADKAW